jgi:ABC-type transport system involved in multi-copper enzyme maturation permease subunit
MRNIWTIAKREFNAYFNSPVAYVLAAMVLVVCGIVMALNISYAMQNPGFAPTGDTVTGVIIFMLVFAVPAPAGRRNPPGDDRTAVDPPGTRH